MSFILDAIAKSERERQQQEVPGPRVLALPIGGVQQTRGLLPYIIVGALVLNAAVLFAWMQGERLPLLSTVHSEEGEPAASDDPARLQQAAGAPVVAGGTARAFRIEPLPEDKLVKTVAPAAEPSSDPAPEQGILQPAPPANLTGEDTSDWIRIGPDTLSNRARSNATAMDAQSTPATSPQPLKVASVSELPDDVRADLPNVVFTGHLYSSDPDSSIVFVDGGRPVAQGRAIADDLWLREITPRGVVVEFRGYLIDVGVLQNWTLN